MSLSIGCVVVGMLAAFILNILVVAFVLFCWRVLIVVTVSAVVLRASDRLEREYPRRNEPFLEGSTWPFLEVGQNPGP